MSIDLRSISGKAVDPTAKPSASRKETRPQGRDQSPASDSVELTDVAARLKQAAEAMTTGTVIDTELVSRVASALQAGTYEIDAEHIAEKLMEMESQLPALEAVDETE